MAAIFLLPLTLFFSVSPAAPTLVQDKSHIINVTERIHAAFEPRAWYSPSRRLAFGFSPDEGSNNRFLVGIWIVDDHDARNNIMVWVTNRENPSVSSNAWIELTADRGKLVLNDDNVETVISDTPEVAAFASMHDSGNLALYAEESSDAIWESFDFPMDTILGGQKLTVGNQLVSRVSKSNFSTGKFRLKMQADGNLVAYPSDNIRDTDSYWSSGTYSTPYINLYLDDAGRLKLEGEDDNFNLLPPKQLNGNYSDTPTKTIYRATLDPDGNFRVYSNTSIDPLWAAFNGTCQQKSLCGFNNYCTLTDYQPSCLCIPGTHRIDDSSNKDCQRNFTKQQCRDGKSDTDSYNLTTTQNLRFDDKPYFDALMPKEEDCQKSCLEDCYCDAAEYYDSKYCNKYTFPLKYVTRDIQRKSTTFFKVGVISITENRRNSTIVTPETVIVWTTSKKTWLLILAVTLSLVVYSCAALTVSGFFLFRIHLIMQYKRLLESGTPGLANELTLRLYSYKELRDATKGFKELLGKGSFGAVYKGVIGEKIIAVKRLQKLVEEGEREFQSEMRVIGKTHHKNLVRLLGYCSEGSKRLLVYEYMSNGSLAGLLYQSERQPDWHERVRIALDVARGILYLHQECDAPIIHCDIKPQNILMDEFWTAKIADFGLAKLLMPDQTRTFTDTRGTRGYMAPEWQKSIPITLKVDVYSYGIVLLEIICCRKSIDLCVPMPEMIQLSGWAYRCFAERELGKLVRDDNGIDMKSFERMVMVALWCIQGDPILRPSMKGVMLMLEGFTTISTPPCPTDS